MKRSFFIFITIIFSALIMAFIATGCANIVPPSGGPRDTLPPTLVRAMPADSTVNFKGNKITLYFNEYIDLRDYINNRNFSPDFETPKVTVRLNEMNILFQDTLLPNTTYTLNFGNSVVDINEGNLLKDFSYTFSTGSRLDTGTLRGKVILAETGTIDSTMIVVLHSNLSDSAIRKIRPPYFSKLDKNGNFSFRNLPNQTFAVYAIGDPASERKYTSPKQLFAFNNTPVTIGNTSSAPVTLFAYRQEPEATTATTNNTNDKRLRYTTNISGNLSDIQKPLIINFNEPLITFDSNKIILTTDSTFTPVTNYTTTLDTSRKIIEIKTAWKEATRYNLILQNDFTADTLGNTLLKTDTLSFTTRKAADYGRLKINVQNIDTTLNPVLQFIQSNKIVFSAPLKDGIFNQAMFLPGEYELNILYDINNNGKWDPGDFSIKKQPEIVIPIERKISVKAATGNDFEVSL